MLPVVKIRFLHLCLPLPCLLRHHLLLSPLLLCHPVQPPRFHRRHLRQNLLFSLLYPQTQHMPSRQLCFLHVAPSARPHFTRHRLCLPCLYHLHCWEMLRTGEDPQQGYTLIVYVTLHIIVNACSCTFYQKRY